MHRGTMRTTCEDRYIRLEMTRECGGVVGYYYTYFSRMSLCLRHLLIVYRCVGGSIFLVGLLLEQHCGGECTYVHLRAQKKTE